MSLGRMMAGHARALRRSVVVGAALAGGVACANQALPRGGPEDFAAPQIVRITPENNAVSARPGQVVLKFDEVISETPASGRDLEELIFISPKSGAPRVDWDRTSIGIRPARGWKLNTVYTVQVKAGLQDLYQNKIDSSIRVVFSTGLPIPDTRLSGVVFDWPEGRGLSGGVVEAVSQDTTIVYQAVADSVGRFELRNIPIGPYFLRAYGDRNNNKDLDPLEIWDSVRVTLTREASAELYAVGRDTVGLRIATIEPTDSNRVLKVTFDKPYAVDQFFVREGARLVQLPDSTLKSEKLVQTAQQKLQLDSLLVRRKADSVAAAAAAKDSLTPDQRARRDSVAAVRRADSVLAVTRQRERAAREAARAAGRRYSPADTVPPPQLKRPKVYKEMYITLDAPLPDGKSYRLQLNGVRSLNEIVKSPARNFTIPRAKVDSSKADSKADSTARRDTTAAPPGRPRGRG
ncbi:Ig-like domain-containing protein [Gemmatimonas sp.]|uniref:Ig-like domain-containing protein n=1 Tax=Gemmatimonas sp. TaxID=1962908 RepID=UPI00391F3F76